MAENFHNVWISSEEKMEIVSKHAVFGFVFEDKGILEVNPPNLTFKGKKEVRHISNVKNLSVFHLKPLKTIQTVTPVILTLMSIVAATPFIMILLYSSYLRSLSTGIAILLWATLFIMLGMIVLAWIIHYSSLGPLGSSRWIKVDCLDDENQPQVIYFADGSWVGWGGLLGGTQSIYEKLNKHLYRQR